MIRIGILSDTHGYLPPAVADFFEDVQEVWHAGDIGDVSVLKKLGKDRPVRAVYGNIDGRDARILYPDVLCFLCEEVKVLMTHIGGYPGRYERSVKTRIESERPALFISGHSHILKVMFDPKYDLLHMNPGAAGKYGIHRSITALRFVIDGKNIRDLEVLDVPR
ncbi:MAG TPA: metallophosphoesterase family protein [Bacteroidales bacterium]|nr:metallophosphoesterase family protein [Bacteroidales bacterium]HPS63406.1 metallophosphoesterase family protein [Bacteroidales bacterium]